MDGWRVGQTHGQTDRQMDERIQGGWTDYFIAPFQLPPGV